MDNPKMLKCGNCPLFDRKNSICNVTFIYEGEDHVLATKATDDCHLITNGVVSDLQSVRIWSDGDSGYIQHTE